MPRGGGNAGGKYTIGSIKDASVYTQAKGAAKDFGPKEQNVKAKKSPNTGSTGTSGKGYSPPPQVGGGKADKVSGAPGAKSGQDVSGVGSGKKLGNHYSNT